MSGICSIPSGASPPSSTFLWPIGDQSWDHIRRIASVELIDLLTSVAEDPRAHAPGPKVFCNIGALATGTHNETGDSREANRRLGGGDGVVTAPRQGLVAKSGDSRNPVGVTGLTGSIPNQAREGNDATWWQNDPVLLHRNL